MFSINNKYEKITENFNRYFRIHNQYHKTKLNDITN